MSQPPLDELYFTWLYGKVGSSRQTNPSKTFWKLLRTLFKKEFVWIVPNDDNRAEDGRDLRKEFINETGVGVDDDWLRLGCSMLELLIGVSIRLEYETDLAVDLWFWSLIRALNLHLFSDKDPYPDRIVEEILDVMIWRTYDANGAGGGLFPLKRPSRDQREVEIWYQLCAFLIENGY